MNWGKDASGKDAFVAYEVKVTLTSKKSGDVIGEGIGCCNSKERRYKNQDAANVANTILKMAKKRAFVDAVLDATGSRFEAGEEEGDFEQAPRPQRAPQRQQQRPQHRPVQQVAPQHRQQQSGPDLNGLMYCHCGVEARFVRGKSGAGWICGNGPDDLNCNFKEKAPEEKPTKTSTDYPSDYRPGGAVLQGAWTKGDAKNHAREMVKGTPRTDLPKREGSQPQGSQPQGNRLPGHVTSLIITAQEFGLDMSDEAKQGRMEATQLYYPVRSWKELTPPQASVLKSEIKARRFLWPNGPSQPAAGSSLHSNEPYTAKNEAEPVRRAA
jgi:hypothetical protein